MPGPRSTGAQSILPETQRSRPLVPFSRSSPGPNLGRPGPSPFLHRRGRFPGLGPPVRSGDFPPRPRPLSRRGPALRSLIGPRWLQAPGSLSSGPPLAEVARLFSKASRPFSEALPLDAAFPAFQAKGKPRLWKRTTIPCRQGENEATSAGKEVPCLRHLAVVVFPIYFSARSGCKLQIGSRWYRSISFSKFLIYTPCIYIYTYIYV